MSAASGLVLSGAMSAQAAEAPAEHDSVSASSVDAKGQAGAPVSAGSSVQITFDRPSVTPTPAPVIEEPKAAAAVLNYGTVVAAPQPGDMIVQSGHVAIYAGNGQVISGGMNGVNATMTHPLSWLTATAA